MNRQSEIEEQKKCDFDRCHCVPNEVSAVVDGKSVFCSQGCADGVGCDHAPCRCRTAEA